MRGRRGPCERDPPPRVTVGQGRAVCVCYSPTPLFSHGPWLAGRPIVIGGTTVLVGVIKRVVGLTIGRLRNDTCGYVHGNVVSVVYELEVRYV
jgi:hypothetical protein